MTDPIVVEVIVEAEPTVVEVVIPGLQGAPGLPGAGGNLITRLAGESLSALRVVAADDAGAAVYANPAAPSAMRRVLGVTCTAALAGETVEIQPLGVLVDAGWAWTPGAPLFVGAVGTLSATPPATGVLRQIGVALTATSILVDLSPVISLS